MRGIIWRGKGGDRVATGASDHTNGAARDPVPPPALGAMAAIGGATLLLHLALAGRYGFFRDELYFLDCGRHLSWGYVDHAPFIGLMAKAALLLGGSLPVLRSIAALWGAALVVLTMVLARELGGGRFAQALAGLAALATPIYLALAGLFTMNVVEQVIWAAAVLVLVRLLRTGDQRLWLLFGALAGFGLMNKHSTAFFGVAVVVALLLSRSRRQLLSPWAWAGAGIALLVFAPNLIWQAVHGFPTLEDLENVRAMGKNVALPPLPFLGTQALMMHPALAPIWLAGLASLLVGRLRRFRPVGLIWVALLVMFMAMKAKDYYLAPAYPPLIAAGGVAVAAWLERSRLTRGRTWPKAVVVAWVVATGAVIAPLALPLLSPAGYVAYERRLGFAPPKTEVAHEGPLPQFLGDQLGWPELVAEVAAVYHSLPPEEQVKTTIFANNYGEAGAINHLGRKLGLPRAISGHQSYWLWGPGDASGDVVIVLQSNREDLEQACASVEEAGRHHHPWGMAEENGPIWVCRGLKMSFPELWPELKHWN